MTTDAKAPKLSAETVINLLANVALPLAADLLDLYFRNGEVTAEDWTKLRAKIRTPFDDLVPQRPGGAS